MESEQVYYVSEQAHRVRVCTVKLQAFTPAIGHVTAAIDEGQPQHLRPGGQPVQVASHTQHIFCAICNHF